MRAREPGAGRWRAARCAGWCALCGCRVGARGEEEEGRAGRAACTRSGVLRGGAGELARARAAGARREQERGPRGRRARVEGVAGWSWRQKGAGSSALGSEERKERGKKEERKRKGKKERERERDSRRHRRSIGHTWRLGARERDARVEEETGRGIRVSGQVFRESEHRNMGKFRKAGVRVLRRGRAQRRETKISARFNLVSFRDVTWLQLQINGKGYNTQS